MAGHWKGRFDHARYGYREGGGGVKNAEGEDIGWWWDKAMHTKSIRGQMQRDLGPRFSPQQLDFLAGLLGDMLLPEPKKRISASKVVQRLHSASAMFGLRASTAEDVLDRGGDSH